jgi:peptidoglycan/LPS O-acetylase OafA/YrhL
MRYRPDITALRAVAVLPVVLFHLGAPLLTGGYIGVDVFFVISGFLITRLIDSDIESGSFTIAQFYQRRVRRIFPALFVMMFVVCIASYLILMPPELKNFGESLASTAAFSSNLMFWYQGMDYFDGPADLKPLLHTWSLAVEEQFYIFFPLLMVVVRSYRARISLLALFAFLSLCLSLHEMQLRPSSAFYLPQCRCWELLFGSLISLLPRRTFKTPFSSNWLQPAGFLAIILPMLLYTSETRFPGLAALPPVLGTCAILYAGETPSLQLNRLYLWWPATFFGNISYSLYLWHWPIIVLYKYVVLRDLRYTDMAMIFIASVLAAAASYYLVENPTRRAQWHRTTLFGASGAIIAVFILFGSFEDFRKGLPSRFAGYAPPPISEPSVQPPAGCWGQLGATGNNWQSASCEITSGHHKTVLWGDSFALHYVAGFERYHDLIDTTIFFLARSGCPPLIGFDHPLEPSCKIFNENAVRYIKELRPDSVVLSARWIYNALNPTDRRVVMADLTNTIQFLDALHINVLVIGQSPSFEFKSTYDYLFRLKRAGVTAADFVPRLDFSQSFQSALAAASVLAHFFDPMAVVCPAYKCSLVSDNRFLTLDGGHLTADKSEEVISALLRADCAQNWQILSTKCNIAQNKLE